MSNDSHAIGKGLGRTTKVLLIVGLVVVVAIPLVVNEGASFVGTDDAAKTAIAEIAPQTQPWVRPVWSPPSREVESLLFSLQAAAGAGIVGYFVGLRRGKADKRPQSGNDRRGGEE